MINIPQHFKSHHEAVRGKDSVADFKLCYYNLIICRIFPAKATQAQYLCALGCVSHPRTSGLGMDACLWVTCRSGDPLRSSFLEMGKQLV